MLEVTLRLAMPRDEAAVSDLLETSYSVLMPSSYDEPVLAAALPLMTRASPSLLSSGKYYLAESARRIVGCGGWSRERPGSKERVHGLAHLRHFATHPAWIGRGVGRSIYSRCEERARAAGVQRFQCYSSLNADGFYAALGFHCVGRIVVPMGRDVSLPGVLMERSIAGHASIRDSH